MERGLEGSIIHRYYTFKDVISEQDCDNFLDKYKDNDLESGAIWAFKDDATGPSWEQQDDRRRAKISWIDVNDAVVRAVWSCVLEANTKYKLNVLGFGKAQLTRYLKDDHYGWHQDSFYHAQITPQERKLSAILQLTKPEDYEGGEVQLFNGEHDLEELPIKTQGSVIVFRSEEWHRVQPVTKGTRYSLVFWSVGPPLE